jgi:hypothetical protein
MDEEYVPEHICRFHSLVLKGVFQETKECVGVTLALGKYEPIFGDLIRLVGDTQVVVRARTPQRASWVHDAQIRGIKVIHEIRNWRGQTGRCQV